MPFCLIMLLGFPASGQSETDLGFVQEDTVEKRASPPGAAGSIERPNAEGSLLVAQSSVNGSAVEPAEMEQLQAVDEERSKADEFLRDLSPDLWKEIEATRGTPPAAREAADDDTPRYDQDLAAARQRAAVLAQELRSMRADLEAVKARLVQETDAASRARKAAQAAANEKHELAARERAKGAALEQDLVAAQSEIDALRNSAETADDEREEALHRELAKARQDLDAMRRAARDANAQARALGDTMAEQRRVLAEQQQKTEELARDLETARHERDAAKEDVTRVSAALREALEHERDRAAGLAGDLAAARKEIDILKARGLRRPELRTTDRPRTTARVRSGTRSAHQPEVQAVERKPPRSVRVLKVLPAALLPTRPPIHAFGP